MGAKFSDFMDDLRAEAEAEGPAAVAELESFHAHFRLSLEFLARRKELGLTQVEVARKAGVPQPVVSRFERGSLNPTCSTLSGLAKAISCTIELVGLEGESGRAQKAGAAVPRRRAVASKARHGRRRPARTGLRRR